MTSLTRSTSGCRSTRRCSASDRARRRARDGPVADLGQRCAEANRLRGSPRQVLEEPRLQLVGLEAALARSQHRPHLRAPHVVIWRPGWMDWSLPECAQRASVERLMGTLASSKMRAASLRLIQSDTTRGTSGPAYSLPLEVDFVVAARSPWWADGPSRRSRLALRPRCRRSAGFTRLRVRARDRRGRGPGLGRGSGVLLRPATALEVDGRRGHGLARHATARSARGGAAVVDAVPDLHLETTIVATVVVGRHLRQPRSRRMPHSGQKNDALRPTCANWQCGHTSPLPESGGSGRSSSSTSAAPRDRDDGHEQATQEARRGALRVTAHAPTAPAHDAPGPSWSPVTSSQ